MVRFHVHCFFVVPDLLAIVFIPAKILRNVLVVVISALSFVLALMGVSVES